MFTRMGTRATAGKARQFFNKHAVTPAAEEFLGQEFVSFFNTTRHMPIHNTQPMNFTMRKAMTMAGVKTVATGSALYLYKDRLQNIDRTGMTPTELRDAQMEAAYEFWKSSFGVPSVSNAFDNGEAALRKWSPLANQVLDELYSMPSTINNDRSVGHEVREYAERRTHKAMGASW